MELVAQIALGIFAGRVMYFIFLSACELTMGGIDPDDME